MAEEPPANDFDDDEDPLVGRLLGDGYVLEERLGGGGFGAVYRARHESGDVAAAKVLRVDRAALSADARTRFRREAQALITLRHPRIVAIHTHGTSADGLEYLVMDLLEGEDLSEHLHRRRRMPVREALALFDGMAEAVQFAHEQGIAHRDLKPANVFLRRTDGKEMDPVVLDFGLAKMIEGSEESLTATGMVMGTPHYMAPEQATGEKIDYRADVYALGCILYEMLVGQPPFDGNTPTAILMQVLTSPPPKIPTDLGVPEGVEDALRRSLHKDPAQRFQDVASFRAALKSSAKSVPMTRLMHTPETPPATREVQAVSSDLTQPTLEYRRPRWVVPVIGGLLALLIAVGGFGAYVGLRQQEETVAATLPTPVNIAPSPRREDAAPALPPDAAAETGETETSELGAPPTEMPEAPPEATPTMRSQPTQMREQRLTVAPRGDESSARGGSGGAAETPPAGASEAMVTRMASLRAAIEDAERAATALNATRNGLDRLERGQNPGFCSRNDLRRSDSTAILQVIQELRGVRNQACEPFAQRELPAAILQKLREFPSTLDDARTRAQRTLPTNEPQDQADAVIAAVGALERATAGTANGRPFPCDDPGFRSLRLVSVGPNSWAASAASSVLRRRDAICRGMPGLSAREGRELADTLSRRLDLYEGNLNGARSSAQSELRGLESALR